MAAEAYRRLHLPVAVSGGRVRGARESEAGLMRAALDTQFSVPVMWVEDRSQTTYENALLTQRLLHPAGIDTVIVVTQAWHMPRALWSFERVGIHALPWPAPRDYMHMDRIDDAAAQRRRRCTTATWRFTSCSVPPITGCIIEVAAAAVTS